MKQLSQINISHDQQYIKYIVKDPEHYPMEIRYFVVHSYLKISENYLTTNPISAYIICITLREIINNLKFEEGFKKQKFIKKNNGNNANLALDNNIELKSLFLFLRLLLVVDNSLLLFFTLFIIFFILILTLFVKLTLFL